VSGWDDPRMPTISGLRRRGYTPESIRDFCDVIGVARRENIIDVELLEHCVRKDLNKIATRVMVVMNPVKVIIDNYPDGKTEMLPAENNPEAGENGGTREIPFGKEIFIERDDFMEVPVKKYFRLGPGLMVRLKHAYILKCESFKKDEKGNISEIHCTYFPESKSGSDTSGISVKGTIHWVSAPQAVPVEVRLYDRLFKVENPQAEEGDFKSYLNEKSLEIISTAVAEPYLKNAKTSEKFQFIRKGYFCVDKDSAGGKIIFNRTVALKDGWSKEQKK
jgi:glutaminyl-tRNA synthetase